MNHEEKKIKGAEDFKEQKDKKVTVIQYQMIGSQERRNRSKEFI